MTATRRIAVAAVAALLFTGLAAAQDPRAPGVGPPDAPKAVKGSEFLLTTEDGLTLGATSWAGATANAPAVVLLHMYKSDRSAWEPLVPYLRARGLDVVAIDLRGHGGSARQGKTDLAPRVEKRDPRLFADMHKDAIAAVRWLVKSGRCDPKRVSIVGASVGCSVALDTARRYPAEVAAVVCLTPGAKYLGLDSLAHAKTFPKDAPLLLVTHTSEADAGSKALHAAIPSSRLLVYDDAPRAAAADGGAHGTRMLGAMPFVERTIASWVAARTGSAADDVVIDGIVTETGPEADPWAKATEVGVGEGGKAWAYRVGRRIVFGGVAPAGCKGLRVWIEMGTIPPTKDAPDVPTIGLPCCSAIDLASAATVWLYPKRPEIPAGVRHGLPDNLGFGSPPAIRVVRDATAEPPRVTFEGECTAPSAPDNLRERDKVRFCILFDAEVGPEPDHLNVPIDDRVELRSR